MIWTSLLARKSLNYCTLEPLRICQVCSRPNLLLSLQTGYCIVCETTDVHTYAVPRGCMTSKNTHFHMTVTAWSIWGLFQNKASSNGHFLWCGIPLPPRLTPGLVHWGAKSNFVPVDSAQTLYQMPTHRSWQCSPRAQGTTELLTAPSCSHVAEYLDLMGLFACSLILQLEQDAEMLTCHARACCHVICRFSGIRKCQNFTKQPESSRLI